MKHVGEYNISDDHETEMMKVRQRVFEFTRRISESDVNEIPACPRCFTELVLMKELWEEPIGGGLLIYIRVWVGVRIILQFLFFSRTFVFYLPHVLSAFDQVA